MTNIPPQCPRPVSAIARREAEPTAQQVEHLIEWAEKSVVKYRAIGNEDAALDFEHAAKVVDGLANTIAALNLIPDCSGVEAMRKACIDAVRSLCPNTYAGKTFEHAALNAINKIATPSPVVGDDLVERVCTALRPLVGILDEWSPDTPDATRTTMVTLGQLRVVKAAIAALTVPGGGVDHD